MSFVKENYTKASSQPEHSTRSGLEVAASRNLNRSLSLSLSLFPPLLERCAGGVAPLVVGPPLSGQTWDSYIDCDDTRQVLANDAPGACDQVACCEPPKMANPSPFHPKQNADDEGQGG